jgi:hypothetical protein
MVPGGIFLRRPGRAPRVIAQGGVELDLVRDRTLVWKIAEGHRWFPLDRVRSDRDGCPLRP